MNAVDQVAYRLDLARGFLREAEQDLQLGRWRSCVDNAQLAVENSGKAVLALYGVSPKTHDPAREVSALLRGRAVDPDSRRAMEGLLPDLLALGAAEHFLTDYGDETSGTLPWDLFTEESAQDAIGAARRSLEGAQRIAASDTAATR